MSRKKRDRSRFPCEMIGLALLAWSFSGFRATWADEGSVVRPACNDARCRNGCIGHRIEERIPAAGPLGYGPPRIYHGFQGFGAGYHLGHGYGGKALGTPAGGYPFYSGPGYPHPWPKLRRIGGINPFPHYAGPGFPTPDHPNYYGTPGPLVVDQPVITTKGGPPGPDISSSYGNFTGAIPYPDSAFAPFTYEPSDSENGPNPAVPTTISTPTSGIDRDRDGRLLGDRDLGFDQVQTVDASRRSSMKVAKVYRGSEADQAGLRVGDVIESINDYRNEQPGHLPWVILNAAPDRRLTMKIRGADRAVERTVALSIGNAAAHREQSAQSAGR